MWLRCAREDSSACDKPAAPLVFTGGVRGGALIEAPGGTEQPFEVLVFDATPVCVMPQ
jgi:hypothetical protein